MKTFPPKPTKFASGIQLKSCAGICAAAFLCCLGLSSADAVTVTWDGDGSPITDWSTFTNWSDNASPTGKDIYIGSTGTTSSSTTVTNTVSSNVSVNSLTYQYTGTSAYHVTEISDGVTLSVGGSTNVFSVGALFSGTTTTNTVVKGATGTLDINQSGGTVFIGNNTTPSGASSKVLLNMSALGTFNANLGSTGNFNIGTTTVSGPGAQQSAATVYLADTNVITTGTLRVSAALQAQNLGPDPSTLYLGRDNTINAGGIYIGRGQGSNAYGILQFNPSVLGSTPSVKIRGSNGTSAVSFLRIGVNETTNTSNPQRGSVNFTGGTVDALITELTIASARPPSSANTGGAQGDLTMDRGIITATNTTLGQVISGISTGTTSATLNINGGQFSTQTLVLADSAISGVGATPIVAALNISGTAAVSVSGTGGITMGTHSQNAANTSPLTTTINLTGGSLTVSGNIAEGAGAATIASTLKLDGGTLEMSDKAITVDTFTAASGTLRNLAQLNSGGTLTKTTMGTLTVSGFNTYTGATSINLGTLLVSGTHNGGAAYTVNNGATLGGGGRIITASNAGVTLATGGKLAPGDLAAGNLRLDVGNGTLDIKNGISSVNSQALIFELGSSSDRITLTNASSALDIGSGILEFDDFVFTNIAGFGIGNYTLFDTGRTIIGTLGSSLTGTIGGYSATLQFSNGDQALVLNVIPEPTTGSLCLAVGGIAWGVMRRRQRKAE